MKKSKLLMIIYVLLVIFWPLIFTFGGGYLERAIKAYTTKMFDYKYAIVILVSYIVAGAVFAFIGIMQNKYSIKSMLFTNIFSVITAFLGFLIYILNTTGSVFISRDITNFIHHSFHSNNACISIGFAACLVIFGFKRNRQKT